ncbi:MAG: hypothetical protein ACO1OB_21900 [Archangium sp.]
MRLLFLSVTMLFSCSNVTTTDQERVRAHLEGAYAQVSAVPNASPRRAELIRWLRAYIDAGQYPVNDVVRERTPIFIDRFGTRCAMAALIERSGHGELVARVAKADNFARITSLAGDAELAQWLVDNGLSLEEAARIQPSYANEATDEFTPTASVLGTLQAGGSTALGFDLLGGPAVRIGTRLTSVTRGACDRCVHRSVALMLEYARMFRLGSPSVNQLALLMTWDLNAQAREHQLYALAGALAHFDEQRAPQLGVGGQLGVGFSWRGSTFPWFVELVAASLWQTRGFGLRGGLNAGVVW